MRMKMRLRRFERELEETNDLIEQNKDNIENIEEYQPEKYEEIRLEEHKTLKGLIEEQKSLIEEENKFDTLTQPKIKFEVREKIEQMVNYKKYQKEKEFIKELTQIIMCPLNLNLFESPILAPSGHVYSEESWKYVDNTNEELKDPLTREPLSVNIQRTHFICQHLISTLENY
mmetsp:Transcript_21744/g.19264  ORF Transcript_21744/g.19264 Transcript_21744/m.19264 type:complete len:173 (+) Transcript_21744:217-735(+)